MTALWRSLTGDYGDFDVFVTLWPVPDAEETDAGADEPAVELIKRWDRKGVMQPVWADDPREVLERGLVPLAILARGRLAKRR